LRSLYFIFKAAQMIERLHMVALDLEEITDIEY